MKIIYAEKSLFTDAAQIGPPFVAEAIAFGPLACVRVGPGFMGRPADEKRAILAHEEGHIAHWHGVTRMLWALIGAPLWAAKATRALVLAQELAADRYACERGHRKSLLRVLRSMRGRYNDATLEVRIAYLARG